MINIEKIKTILKKVIEKVSPNEESLKIATNFVSELNHLLKKQRINAKAVIGGSVAKNTFLQGDYDVDVFVKFNKEFKGKNISDLLEKVLKKNFDFTKVKGSRDYFHVQKKLLFEIVPVIDVSNINEAENIMDMSPLHVDYFKKKGSGLEDEVRLLKVFMKANRVYGAESFINGFSGHVVDLLVIRYGSFMNVLKSATKWSPKVIIDIEKKIKNPMMELDKAKISGPLILIDPVQDNRNAAAALGNACFNKFVCSAKSFLKKPDEDFFRFKTAKEIIKNKKGFLFEIKIDPLKKKSKDVAGSKTLKIIEFLLYEFEKNDFFVKSYEWDFDFPTNVYFLLENIQLGSTKTIRGPPLSQKSHCDSFKKKHKNFFQENNFLCANTQRKFTDASSLIEFLCKSKYVLTRCQNITFLFVKKN